MVETKLQQHLSRLLDCEAHINRNWLHSGDPVSDNRQSTQKLSLFHTLANKFLAHLRRTESNPANEIPISDAHLQPRKVHLSSRFPRIRNLLSLGRHKQATSKRTTQGFSLGATLELGDRRLWDDGMNSEMHEQLNHKHGQVLRRDVEGGATLNEPPLSSYPEPPSSPRPEMTTSSFSFSSFYSDCWRFPKGHMFHVAPLALGGFGKIFLLKLNEGGKRDEKYLVMKIVNIGDKDMYHNLRMEVEALRRIRHNPHQNLMEQPNLGPGVDNIWWSKKDATLTMLLKYYPVDLNGLRQRVPGGLKPTQSILQKIVSDVVNGLVHLHENGIIHKDLKPSNILIDHTGSCRLADFGGAFVFEDREGIKEAILTTDVGLFTKEYRAPEMQASMVLEDGVKYHCFDASVDFWSLGICIFDLLMGGPPDKLKFISSGGIEHVCPSMGNFVSKMREEVHNTWCDGSIKDFFHRCSELRPKDRIHGDEAMYIVMGWEIDDRAIARYINKNISRGGARGPSTMLRGCPPFFQWKLEDPAENAKEIKKLARGFQSHLEKTHTNIPEHSSYCLKTAMPDLI